MPSEEEAVLRSLMWRMLGVLAIVASFLFIAWFLEGGPGRALRGNSAGGIGHIGLRAIAAATAQVAGASWNWTPASGIAPLRSLLAAAGCSAVLVSAVRGQARHRRRYVRMRIEVYRTDRADAATVERMFDTVQFLDSPGDGHGAGGPEAGQGSGREAAGEGDDDLEAVGAGAGVEDGLAF